MPVRFAMACAKGHLQDVRWNAFVHYGNPSCPNGTASLFLREGDTRDFADIRVQCESCGKRRMLADLYNPELAPRCDGEQPWLGPNVREDGCEERPRLIVRTASNAYFAQVVSALSIPDTGNEVRDAVESVIGKLEIVKDADGLRFARQYSDVSEAIGRYADPVVLEALAAIRAGKKPEREPLRTAEYHRLIAEPIEQPGDLPPVNRQYFARACSVERALPAGFRKLVRVHRLREVRVQVGFTRLEVPTPDLQGEFDLAVQTAPLAKGSTWLPAAEVLGEGLFLALDEEAVLAWEERASVKARARLLEDGYNEWADTMAVKPPPFPGARYYMLHSLSHLLMTALAMECGYGASALSERIYCSLPKERTHKDKRMAGILIKTGTAGAEGTLGGLVNEGLNITKHLRRAFDLGTLCAHDPVCAGHQPKEDLEGRLLDGAACHGCLYIAESSCERFNRYLDRALAVPTLGCPEDLAFLRERP